MEISNIDERAIQDIIALHAKAFPDEVGTRMGPMYLRLLYSSIFNSKGSPKLGMFDSGSMVGYVLGFKSGYATVPLISILAHPSILINWVRNEASFNDLKKKIMDRVKRPPSLKEQNTLKVCRLVIAVLPTYQGRGVGATLLGQFVGVCRELEFNQLGLSVLKTNASAIRLYEKMGWIIQSQNDKLLNYLYFL